MIWVIHGWLFLTVKMIDRGVYDYGADPRIEGALKIVLV
jgi:hypothetical protein